MGWIRVPFSPGRLTGPKPPGSRAAPTFQGRVEPWGVSPHFPPRPGRPLLPAPPPKLPASPLPKAPLFWARSRQEAGGAWRRKGAEGRERGGGGGGDTLQEVSRTPEDTTPSPFGSESMQPPRVPPQVHPELTADVPLNQTIRSKTRKTRLLLESPISLFATLIPVLQECEAVTLFHSWQLRSDLRSVLTAHGPPLTGPAQVSLGGFAPESGLGTLAGPGVGQVGPSCLSAQPCSPTPLHITGGRRPMGLSPNPPSPWLHMLTCFP